MNATELAGRPLLTIAIPTYNRQGYLRQNLAQLKSEIDSVGLGLVELLVSDNCSPDATPQVVEEARAAGLEVRYVRNERNLGWALNFAQAFDLATGKYILMCGDDDLLVDGALKLLIDRLQSAEYGVVCLKPYGFDADFRAERPSDNGRERVFTDPSDFLIATHRCFTLTSCLVLNKDLLAGVSSRQFIDTDLATFHLVLRAALAGRQTLFVERYLVASKRQNSFSYEFADVFVEHFWRILDLHLAHGLRRSTISALERRRLFSYYPFYMLDLRASGRGDVGAAYNKLARRFAGRPLFEFWLAPTLRLPRPLALIWGSGTTLVGRLAAGDFRRFVAFALNKLGYRRRPSAATIATSGTD